MANFSNHSEGEAYWAQYCRHCVHGGKLDTGEPRPCMIWGLHLMFNGNEDMQRFLDALIPQAGNDKLQCELFHSSVDIVEAKKEIVRLTDLMREHQHEPIDRT